MCDEELCSSSQFQAKEQSKGPRTSHNEEPCGSSAMASTSQLSSSGVNAEGEEDLVDLCRRLDTQLEEKAKMHNLNALNVKSILHRLIKDPHVLSALMGIKGDSDDIPTLKVTRSKVKHTSSELAKVELKPVQPPRTFLDVHFENEDDDEDYRPEDIQSDESEDEEEAYDSVTVDTEQNKSSAVTGRVEESNDVIDGKLMISDGANADGGLSPYQLRSRVPHLEHQDDLYGSLDTSFTPENFDTFTDYHGQEMLTFVENPDYLDFLQGIHSSTPAQGNENVVVDDDDPDDEEYNVLTELEKLEELERDKDELRMDRFTEIPLREVEGLFLDLIGDDVQTIRPELIPLKIQTPKKKRAKKRRSAEGISDSEKSTLNSKSLLPVDEPPPDGSFSHSLISEEPIKFKPEELAQLRIQLEQHVQLLTQSVVMCYHDNRLTHVKNEYQLMINALDSFYYEGGGESSLFNIDNLGAAIESCHDIMGVTPVEEEHVKWDPNPFGWSPRPEAALVLGRSRAIIYPDLLPGVQPDLFEFPHQFFTPGEDLLLAHALIQFRHIPQSTSQDPFGRLYWVQKMLLPCKTISQIRAHIRLARNHTEGQVNNRNPIYQIIMQALRGVCHLRFPFERPVARYDTLQMWPDEERPIWYNKFLKHFMTIGPTMVVPCGIASRDQANQVVQSCEGIIPAVPIALTPERKSNIAVCSSSIFYEVDVAFKREEEVFGTMVYARPFSYCFESAFGNFHILNVNAPVGTSQNTASFGFVEPVCISMFRKAPTIHVKNEPEVAKCRMRSLEMASLTKKTSFKMPSQEASCDLSLYPALDSRSSNDASVLPEIHEADDCEFSVYEPNREFEVPSGSQHPETLQIPKSEFSVDDELEEGEIASGDSSREGPQTSELGRKKDGSSYEFRFRQSSGSKSKSSLAKNGESWTKASSCRESEGISRSDSSLRRSSRTFESSREYRSLRASRRCRARERSADVEWTPENLHDRKRLKRQREDSKNSYRGSSEQVKGRKESDCSRGPVRREEENSSHRKMQRRIYKKGGQKISGSTCSITYELRAHERTAVVFKQIKSQAKRVVRLKEDLSNSAAVVVEPAGTIPVQSVQDNMPSNESLATTSTGATEWYLASAKKSWKDSDCVFDDFDLHPLDESRISGEQTLQEYNSYAVPRTPTFSTPSSNSTATFCQLSGSTSRSPFSDYGVPVTPRDDVLTRSPTLLRAPSAASRALFAKIEIKSVPNPPAANAELTTVEPSSNCWRSVWDCENSDPALYNNDHDDARPSSAFDAAGHDDCEEIPEQKSFDDFDAGAKTRMKRRTRTEKERMGLERMQNLHHRSRQMQNLARKIADDIRQRTFMHQDVWRSLERVVLGDDNLEAQFDSLKAALLPRHADVFVLLSLLTDDSILPPELLTSPLRRAYHGAVQMLLAIEAYCHGTRSRNSNTRSLLKTIGTMGQTLNESDFCDRLSDLLSNERPLWSYIRQWLPLPYEENVTSADFEFIDLRKKVETNFLEDDGAECIDDLSEVLGPPQQKKGGVLQVAGGQLNLFRSGTYVPVLVTKEREDLEENKMPHEPTWTKDVDILILKTYNSVDGSIEDVAAMLTQKIPYSSKDIERRLNFLVSLF